MQVIIGNWVLQLNLKRRIITHSTSRNVYIGQMTKRTKKMRGELKPRKELDSSLGKRKGHGDSLLGSLEKATLRKDHV